MTSVASTASSRSRRARVFGALRVLVYVSVVVTAALLLWTRSVVAKLGEQSLALGEELGAWSSLIGPSTAVAINGQELFLGSMHVALPVEAVIDRFSALCLDDSGQAAALTESLRDADADEAREPGLLEEMLVWQMATEDKGVAACLAGAGKDGVAGLRTRLSTFRKTLDLSSIGALRYVLVTKAAGGSHVVAVWNRDGLRIDQMFPLEGDAPGEDLVEGVRPRNARRILSASPERSEHRMSMYLSDSSPAVALADYEHGLAAKGYRPAFVDDARVEAARTYVKDGKALVVAARPNAQGSALSVLELARYAPTERKAP